MTAQPPPLVRAICLNTCTRIYSKAEYGNEEAFSVQVCVIRGVPNSEIHRCPRVPDSWFTIFPHGVRRQLGQLRTV
jgi:hypothetical protein